LWAERRYFGAFPFLVFFKLMDYLSEFPPLPRGAVFIAFVWKKPRLSCCLSVRGRGGRLFCKEGVFFFFFWRTPLPPPPSGAFCSARFGPQSACPVFNHSVAVFSLGKFQFRRRFFFFSSKDSWCKEISLCTFFLGVPSDPFVAFGVVIFFFGNGTCSPVCSRSPFSLIPPRPNSPVLLKGVWLGRQVSA